MLVVGDNIKNTAEPFYWRKEKWKQIYPKANEKINK